MNRILRFSALVVWVLLFSHQLLVAQDSEKFISATANPVPNSYIVVLDDAALVGPFPPSVAQVANDLAMLHSGVVKFLYTAAPKGFSVSMEKDRAMILSRDPRVKYVEEDVMGGPAVIPWGLDRTDQRYLPLNNSYTYTFNGSGVNAYIIDSGIRFTHQDFGGRAYLGADFVNDGKNGVDCIGHGTAVASVIGGATSGIAKNAKLYALRVLDCESISAAEQAISALDWIKNNGIKPAVVNISLGYAQNTTLNAKVSTLISRGFVVVVAAGNDNTSNINTSPQTVSEAHLVGATDITDRRVAAFSNFGSRLDLFAPGVDIRMASISSDTAYRTDSGTSFASPHVAGVAAQFLDYTPSATVSTVNSTIVNTATNSVVINAGSGSPNKLVNISCFKGSIPATPTLVSPANGVTGVSTDQNFDWNDASRACQYQWQLSTSNTFSNLVFDWYIYDSQQLGIVLDPLTTYYWRVRANNIAGWSSWSAVWSFRTRPR